jgi:hypothetical protein
MNHCEVSIVGMSVDAVKFGLWLEAASGDLRLVIGS